MAPVSTRTYAMELTCGDCRYFKTTREREDGRLGICRLEKLMGVYRESMRACPSFSRLGDPNPPVHSDSGPPRGARRQRSPIQAAETQPTPVSAHAVSAAIGSLGPDELKLTLCVALTEAQLISEPDLGRYWAGGMLVMVPADSTLKVKEIGLEVYFHKLVMIRDNLRVLEQKINSHPQLHDSERVDIQRYIALCYNSVVSMATGWLPRLDGPGPQGELVALLRDLVLEIRWSALFEAAPPMGSRWQGGTIRYTRDGVEHEEPIESFYFRMVILRDRLAALESVVSAHPHIAPDEATVMSGYLRRCYGSLTTFNVLLRDRRDYFAGSK